MQKYVALLRGINVSGKNKILMKELKTLLEGLDFVNVITYIQSGNVLFETNKDRSSLANLIYDKIHKAYNYSVQVIIKTPEEIENVINNNPFLKDTKDIKKLYVCFMDSAPSDTTKLDEFDFGKDEFMVVGDVVYLKYDLGAGKTKLSNNIIEKKLGVHATSRNWNTTNKLLSLSIS